MSFKKTKNKKAVPSGRQGFTLIEIIITMSIIMFLSATMFQVISTTDTQQGLIMSADKVKAGMRLAQTYSLSVPQDSNQRDVCGFGVHSDGSSTLTVYYLYNNNFSGNPTACDTIANLNFATHTGLLKEDEQEIDLGTNYAIYAGPEIFFKTPYGKVVSNGAILPTSASYTVVNAKNGSSKAITINREGKISL